MIIKSIATEYITESPFRSIIDPAYLDEFAPYYNCTIVADVATVYGSGATEYEAEQAATANLAGQLAAQMHTAIAQYNVRNRAGNLEIA